jgi:hypothetical protein
MTSWTRVLRLAACSAAFSFLCGFVSDRGAKFDTDFILTAAPVYEPLAALRGKDRFPQGAQLLLVHEGQAEPLVAGFAATADANVFFDGTRVLFAGRKAAIDPWQIWEIALADHAVRQLTAGADDAIRPLYLPESRFVYAQRPPTGVEMRTASLDPASASNAPANETLSFANANAIPTDVLADGRILFEGGYPIGTAGTPEVFLVYSDGSGVESYRCDHGAARWGGKQLASGDIVFTHGAKLARFTSPLAHEEPIAAPPAQYAGAVAEVQTGVWLVSARRNVEKTYGINRWKPGTARLETVFRQNGMNLVEPVLLAPRPTPKRHPSALHPWSYANLLALDARLSREGTLKTAPVSVHLETRDANGLIISLGTAPVESDGSYFVQVPGDRALRFALLDARGTVLRQEHGWFWARAGEQRICVGCHTGPERAADNAVPAVLLRTTTPVDLTGVGKIPAAQSASVGGSSK